MKVRTTFKSPDAVFLTLDNLPREQALRDQVDEVISKFVRYGEYVTIEFDVETGTATVVPL